MIVPGLVLGCVAVGLLSSAAGVSSTLLSLLFGIGLATVTSSTSALVTDLSKEGGFGASIGVLRT